MSKLIREELIDGVKKVEIRFKKFGGDILMGDIDVEELKIDICRTNKVVFEGKLELPMMLRRLEIGGFKGWLTSLDDLPENLEELVINHVKNFDLSLDNLPRNLRYFYFGGVFVMQSDYYCSEYLCSPYIRNFDYLPDNLQVLELSVSLYNNRLDNLPKNLRELKLCLLQEFNQNLDNLPESLKRLELLELINFNQSLDHLPENLEYLELNALRNFSHSLDYLPKELKILRVNAIQVVNFDYLPQKLEKLEFEAVANPNPIKLNYLPKTLKNLEINYCQVTNLIIPNVKSLIIKNIPLINFMTNLPKTLEELEINSDYYIDLNNLPMVNNLKVYGPINCLDNLPSSLRNFELYVFDSIDVRNLPNGIKKLRLFFRSNQEMSIINLPQDLKRLEINSYQGVIGYGEGSLRLPENLEELIIEGNRRSIPQTVNPKLKKVDFNFPMTNDEFSKIEEFISKFPHIETIYSDFYEEEDFSDDE